MTHQLPHHSVSKSFNKSLDRTSYITDPVSSLCLSYSYVKRLVGPLQQIQHFATRTFQRVGISGITVIPLVLHATVDGDDVAFFQFVVSRYPMHHHIVGGDAQRGRKPVVVEEGRYPFVVPDKLLCLLIQFLRLHPRLYQPSYFTVGLCQDTGTFPHDLDLLLCLQVDHSTFYAAAN